MVPRGDAVRYLGIWFSCFGTTLRKEWWQEWLEKMEKKLQGWEQLNLTLMGRVCVLNIFWLPKIWYLARQMDLPEWVLKRIEKIVRGWLWKKKRS